MAPAKVQSSTGAEKQRPPVQTHFTVQALSEGLCFHWIHARLQENQTQYVGILGDISYIIFIRTDDF